MIWRAALGLLAMCGQAAAACSDGVAELRWQDGGARFYVEIADDSAERAQGLMFREAMRSSAGMLFVYDRPQKLSFWMRNTLIPLDIIFISAEGVVTHIHPMAVPKDETPIDGGPEAQFVLEINGGLAARLGLVEGAVLRHPAIDEKAAKWPCDAQ
ncbi:MAG: DUF192 domain-containing protein [Albidovulum sp.]